VVFAVQVPENLLNNWTLTPLAPQISSATIRDQTTNLVIGLQTTAGQALQGMQLVSQLSFVALTNQTSTFVALPIASVQGFKPSGLSYSNYVTGPGFVAIVQKQPLLRGKVSSQAARTLTVYGRPGTNYQLQFTTNLAPPGWQPVFNYVQTNGNMDLGLDTTNHIIFYRLQQQ